MLEGMTEDQARKKILSLVATYCETFHKRAPYALGQRIPYAARLYDQREMVSLVDCALDFWLTSGRYAAIFEKEFASFLGVKHCALVNSGSSANLLAFMALTSPLLGKRRIVPGDEIITVAAGFPTTVAPIVQYGAIPVFIDVTIPQYNLDPNLLQAALSSKTKAVMAAHTMGNPFDLAAVKEFCSTHGLWLIEDNCDALGATFHYDGQERFTGTVGDIGTSSFYPSHHITLGEGGAVYTNDSLLSEIIFSMRDWGRDCKCPSGQDDLCGRRFDGQHGQLPFGYDHKYVYSHLGYNFKATDMQAAIGVEQLKKLPEFVKIRRKNFDWLKSRLLSANNDAFILPQACPDSNPSWFGFLLTCKKTKKRNAAIRHLEEKGIQTRMLFAGNVVKQPCFAKSSVNTHKFRIIGDLTNTERIMNDSFWVGIYPGLNEVQLSVILNALLDFSN